MRLAVHDSIFELDPGQWNRTAGGANPFMRHEFLGALERHGCVGEAHGWIPQHLSARDADGRLMGAVALYLKDNSYGEFVFDWAWADAYARAGGRYYPKLVAAAPYTPASGPRLLLADDAPAGTGDRLIELALAHARELKVSSLHWLFTDAVQTRLLQAHGFLRRTGCQFHWHNRGYRDFEDYLDSFSAQKRKKVKRERRRVQESGLAIELVHGNEASEEQIATAEMFYRTTFDRKWGVATLNLPFFQDVAEQMGEQLVLVFAREGRRYVAGAICYRDLDTLYGRHWGCSANYHSLHFELCYYQGLDYCIREGLQRFEPGAQGEHKVSRGFLPTPTWSAHWLADARFAAAIDDYLQREHRGMEQYMAELGEHAPFKRGTDGDAPPP